MKIKIGLPAIALYFGLASCGPINDARGGYWARPDNTQRSQPITPAPNQTRQKEHCVPVNQIEIKCTPIN